MMLQVSYIVAFLFAGLLHPYYVSIFDIDHNSETKTLQIAVRIFTDDLEDALEDEGGYKNIRLGGEEEAEDAEEWVQKYVSEHLTITVNGQQVPLKYLGRELEKELIWCYLESDPITELSQIQVESDLLMATFEDQTNLVHINANGSKRSMILKKRRIKETIDY